jgi:alpha-amylase/alpha-mannosidase (GH57 family)
MTTNLDLILCWHFHQPDYRTETGEYLLPWVYLHAFKDYSDMAAHLENAPAVRAVVNFVPVLVEQIDDYDAQFQSGKLRDPLLAELIADRPGATVAARRLLVESCFRLNHPTMVDYFPAYRRLYTLYKTAEEDGDRGLAHLSDQFFADLVMWYHLAWSGESLRRVHPELVVWLEQGGAFSLADRRGLFELIGRVVHALLPRYRHLAERGQIEISTTPHSHPMLPLLLDFNAANEANTALPLPHASAYPGGALRAHRHVEAALESHKRHFGSAPTGVWPAEGAVSDATVAMLDGEGFAWVASGGGVLRNSLATAGLADDAPAWRVGDSRLVSFFRNDHLSDLIGFEYKGWHANDAVRHFMHALESHFDHQRGKAKLAVVILDGENAWEYFSYNGWHFLSELYAALSASQTVRSNTFADWLAQHDDAVGRLPHVVAGSWVYGDFSTWMGDAAKNRAWDMLCAAKATYDRAIEHLPGERRQQAEFLLMSCESSDWFWWFGDYNPGPSVQAFDRVYRRKLANLYEVLGVPVPDVLSVPLCRGGEDSIDAGGVMRRGS